MIRGLVDQRIQRSLLFAFLNGAKKRDWLLVEGLSRRVSPAHVLALWRHRINRKRGIIRRDSTFQCSWEIAAEMTTSWCITTKVKCRMTWLIHSRIMMHSIRSAFYFTWVAWFVTTPQDACQWQLDGWARSWKGSSDCVLRETAKCCKDCILSGMGRKEEANVNSEGRSAGGEVQQ